MSFPPYIDIVMQMARMIVAASLAVVVFLGLQRASLEKAEKRAVGYWFVAVYLLWVLVVSIFAVRGVFVPGRSPLPLIPFAIFLPIIVFSIVLLRSGRIMALLSAMPVPWLVRLQSYRVFGGIFILLYLENMLPPQFALPAGLGDILVGVLALVVARRLAADPGSNLAAGYAWNVLGILDLAVAVTMGTLTAPGPLQVIASGTPNLAVGQYPLVLVPAFAVPLSIILHVLSIRQLSLVNATGRRATAQGGFGAAVLSASTPPPWPGAGRR